MQSTKLRDDRKKTDELRQVEEKMSEYRVAWLRARLLVQVPVQVSWTRLRALQCFIHLIWFWQICSQIYVFCTKIFVCLQGRFAFSFKNLYRSLIFKLFSILTEWSKINYSRNKVEKLQLFCSWEEIHVGAVGAVFIVLCKKRRNVCSPKATSPQKYNQR